MQERRWPVLVRGARGAVPGTLFNRLLLKQHEKKHKADYGTKVYENHSLLISNDVNVVDHLWCKALILFY